MPQIEVITTALTDTAKRIGEIIDTIQGCQRYISGTALNGLEDYFSGTLPNVMVNFLLAKQSAYDKMLSALEGYKQAIESSAATYEASEEQLTKWADHLGDKGIHMPSIVGPNGMDPNRYNADDYQQYADVAYWNGSKWYTMSNNCWGFVDHILNIEGRNRISGRYSGEAYINGFDSYLIEGGQYIARPTSPSATDIQSIFRNAQIGDVVQMKWKSPGYSTVAHTAMIADIDENGVKFIQSNTKGQTINNTYYTWDKLSELYSNVGYGGGASIYRP